jgi:hypothetical protein
LFEPGALRNDLFFLADLNPATLSGPFRDVVVFFLFLLLLLFFSV